jgi:hypothetical protein
MAIQAERFDAIIAGLTSASIEEKLKAIEEAQDLNKNIFAGELTPTEWAYRAMVIENQYNLIRDILKENFKKVNPSELAQAVEPKVKNAKPSKGPKKKVPLKDDPEFKKMIAEMMAGKKEGGESSVPSS